MYEVFRIRLMRLEGFYSVFRDQVPVRGIGQDERRVSVKDERLAAIRPHFSEVMARQNWLPEEFRRTPEEGGIGRGIANWLLYRDSEGTLSFAALVLPPGAATPVHDHLAWGLVREINTQI